MLREERRIPQTYNYLYSPTSNEVDLYLSFPFPHSPHCVVYVFQCTVLCMRQAGVYFLLWVSGVYAMAKKVKHKLNIGHPTLLCLSSVPPPPVSLYTQPLSLYIAVESVYTAVESVYSR